MSLFNWGQNNGNAPTPGGARPIGQQPTSNPGMSTFGFPTAPPRTAMPGGAQPTGPMPGIPVSPASNGPGGILTAFGQGLFAGGNGIAPPAQQPLPARTVGVSGAQPVGGGGGITQPIGAPIATPGRNVAAPILGGPRVTPISGGGVTPPTMTWGQSNIQPIINRSLPGLPSWGPQPLPGAITAQQFAAGLGGVPPQQAQVTNPLGWGARPQPMSAPAGAGPTLGAGAPRGNRNRQPGQ